VNNPERSFAFLFCPFLLSFAVSKLNYTTMASEEVESYLYSEEAMYTNACMVHWTFSLNPSFTATSAPLLVGVYALRWNGKVLTTNIATLTWSKVLK
jgi:hypothetical protein